MTGGAMVSNVQYDDPSLTGADDNRQHVRKDGTPKVAYRRRTAEVVGAHRGLVAYRCTVCKSWHVGNPR